jgi:hypothetical protein
MVYPPEAVAVFLLLYLLNLSNVHGKEKVQ